MITDRSGYARSQALKCNMQINSKLHLSQNQQTVQFVPDHMKINPHQKVVNALSDPRFMQGPLVFKNSDNKNLVPESRSQGLAAKNDSFQAISIQRNKLQENKHKIENSPVPVKENKKEEESRGNSKIPQKANELPQDSSALVRNNFFREGESFVPNG